MAESPEVHLWRAVIGQAFDDATSRSLNPEVQRERPRARAWLLRGGDDFNDICHMAMLDPDAVRDSADKLCSRGWPTQGSEPDALVTI